MQQDNIRRKPSQQRSKKRVEAILEAAKSLIAEKGSAQLRIQEIAERAGVNQASIYQYFPSKNAVIEALAKSVFSHSYETLVEDLPAAATQQEAYGMLQQLTENVYQIYLDDPALLDLWHSISTDKSIQHLDLAGSRRNADLIFNCIKQFYDESRWPGIASASFLLAHMGNSAVRMALQVEREEGRVLIDNFKRLISPDVLEAMIRDHNQSDSE